MRISLPTRTAGDPATVSARFWLRLASKSWRVRKDHAMRVDPSQPSGSFPAMSAGALRRMPQAVLDEALTSMGGDRATLLRKLRKQRPAPPPAAPDPTPAAVSVSTAETVSVPVSVSTPVSGAGANGSPEVAA